MSFYLVIDPPSPGSVHCRPLSDVEVAVKWVLETVWLFLPGFYTFKNGLGENNTCLVFPAGDVGAGQRSHPIATSILVLSLSVIGFLRAWPLGKSERNLLGRIKIMFLFLLLHLSIPKRIRQCLKWWHEILKKKQECPCLTFVEASFSSSMLTSSTRVQVLSETEPSWSITFHCTPCVYPMHFCITPDKLISCF